MKYMDRDKLGFLEPGRVKEILMKQGKLVNSLANNSDYIT